MSIFFLLLAAFFIGDLVCWVLADRAARQSVRPMHTRFGVALFFAVMLGGFSAIILGRVLDSPLAGTLPRFVTSTIYLWHLLVLPVVLALHLLALLGRAGRRIVRAFKPPRAESTKPTDGVVLSRRQFLATVAALGPPAASLSMAGIAATQAESFRVRALTIPIPNLPPALDGLRIAHLSDIHVGRFTSGAVLDRMIAATNALHADLLLVTGDIINDSLRDLPVALDTIRQMKARDGTFLCEGNHDLFDGAAKFETQVQEAGLTLLVNSTAEIQVRGERVQILGLQWGGHRSGKEPRHYGERGIGQSMEQLLSLSYRDHFKILLAHHPHAFDFLGDKDIPLTFSGHTHGGQIMLNDRIGFGPAFFRYWSGHTQRDGRSLVVSNGAGNWFPLRVHAPAEILDVTLRRA